MEKEKSKKYIPVCDLDAYKQARILSETGWEIYQKLEWQDKKIMGDQFIEATDSVGANIAEGYARYHFLDRIKFYYNARGSLSESLEHWIELLYKREKVDKTLYLKYKEAGNSCGKILNHFIGTTYNVKNTFSSK